MASDDRLRKLLDGREPGPSGSWIVAGDIDEDQARAIAKDLAKKADELANEELRKAEEQD